MVSIVRLTWGGTYKHTALTYASGRGNGPGYKKTHVKASCDKAGTVDWLNHRRIRFPTRSIPRSRA